MELLDDVCHMESHFGLFRNNVSFGARYVHGLRLMHYHYLQIDRSKILYDTRHLGLPSCASRLFSKHLVCSMQTVHLSCFKISTISKQTEPSLHLSLFTQEYQQVLPKWFLRLWCIIRKPCTYLAPKLILALSTSNEIPYDTRHQGVLQGVSKLISKHMVRSKQTVHLSCIKISTISKSTEQSFHLSLLPRSSIGSVQNHFLAYAALCANLAPILHRN